MHQNKENKKQSKIKPLISVIICTYNRADYLKKCLDSMRDQTHDNFEVIVVNGASTDNAEEILKNYSFKVVQQKGRSGLSAARNLGIKEAKGEIISFIDDDAIADRDWLKNLIKEFKDESVACIGGATYYVNDTKEIIIKTLKWEVNKFGVGRWVLANKKGSKYKSKHIWFNYVHGCNSSFRKKVLEGIGGFDEYYTYWLDESDVCVRIAKAGYKIEYEPDAIVYHTQEGAKRSDIWYHIVKNQVYFTFKNFGDELSLTKIVWGNFKIFVGDLISVTLNLLKGRMYPIDYIKSIKNMIIGRIQGYKDGIKVRRK